MAKKKKKEFEWPTFIEVSLNTYHFRFSFREDYIFGLCHFLCVVSFVLVQEECDSGFWIVFITDRSSTTTPIHRLTIVNNLTEKSSSPAKPGPRIASFPGQLTRFDSLQNGSPSQSQQLLKVKFQ